MRDTTHITHPAALWHPSPSFGPRRGDATPELVVLHYTAMATARSALNRLCDPDIEVSAHYLISEQGQIWQMVTEDMRAWHAGGGQWHSITDVNSASIGIELANDGFHPFPEPQMVALESLLEGILKRWHIPAKGVIGHSDMAPGRKIDPGQRFDWSRLAQQGLAVWPSPMTCRHADPELFRHLAKQTGYTSDVPVITLLQAVRLRFRPYAKGPLQAEDIAVLQGLL